MCSIARDRFPVCCIFRFPAQILSRAANPRIVTITRTSYEANFQCGEEGAMHLVTVEDLLGTHCKLTTATPPNGLPLLHSNMCHCPTHTRWREPTSALPGGLQMLQTNKCNCSTRIRWHGPTSALPGDLPLLHTKNKYVSY